MSRNSTGNQNKRGAGNGWVQHWRLWLQQMGLVDLAKTPRSGSRIKRLEIVAGSISALVQGRDGTACEVEIRVVPWHEAEWQVAMDVLGSQAMFSAQLLAGELPPELDEALNAGGVGLLPASRTEVMARCSCCGQRKAPCEHAVAVYQMLGEMLADDPWLLLRLRGRDQVQILRALREQRTHVGDTKQSQSLLNSGNGKGGFYPPADKASGTGGEENTDEALPLRAQLDNFWGVPKTLSDFRLQITPPHVELTLLRRLGPPPFTTAATETQDTLAAIYRRVTQSALALAYATDADNPAEDGNGNGNGNGNGAVGNGRARDRMS
jgi:uncharacterized Zn finger protein